MTPRFEGLGETDYTARYGPAFNTLLDHIGKTGGYEAALYHGYSFLNALISADDPRIAALRPDIPTDLIHLGKGYGTGEMVELPTSAGVPKRWSVEWRMLHRSAENPHQILRLCEVDGKTHRVTRPTGHYVAREVATGTLIPFAVTPAEAPASAYTATPLAGEAAEKLFSQLAMASERLTKERRERAYTTVLSRARSGAHTYKERFVPQINGAFTRSEDPRLRSIQLAVAPEGGFHKLTHAGEYGQLVPHPSGEAIDDTKQFRPIWARFHPPNEHTSQQPYEVLRLIYTWSGNGQYVAPGAEGLYLVKHFSDHQLIPVAITSENVAIVADGDTAAFIFKQLCLAALYEPPHLLPGQGPPKPKGRVIESIGNDPTKPPLFIKGADGEPIL